jgi:hypothetical protein
VKKRSHFENLGADGRSYYNESSRSLMVVAWNGLIWLRIETGGGPF